MPERSVEQEVARLLRRAGARPRYVRRVVGELEDHAQELRGALSAPEAQVPRSPGEVEAEVRRRLGSPAAIAAGALTDPRSLRVACRWPRLAFGLVPLVLVPVASLALAFLIVGSLILLEDLNGKSLASMRGVGLYGMLGWLLSGVEWVAPVGATAFSWGMARRARMPQGWFVLATAMICVASFASRLDFRLPGPDLAGELSFGIGAELSLRHGLRALLALPLAGLLLLRVRTTGIDVRGRGEE